jgi:hypothetical protein
MTVINIYLTIFFLSNVEFSLEREGFASHQRNRWCRLWPRPFEAMQDKMDGQGWRIETYSRKLRGTFYYGNNISH